MLELKNKIVNWFKKINYSKIGKGIEITFIFLLLVFTIAKIFIKDPEYYISNKQEQKAIQSKVDSISLQQAKLSEDIKTLQQGQIIFYDIVKQSVEEIENNNKELIKLRKQYNEKLNRTDIYTISDIDSFFRAKYPNLYKD